MKETKKQNHNHKTRDAGGFEGDSRSSGLCCQQQSRAGACGTSCGGSPDAQVSSNWHMAWRRQAHRRDHLLCREEWRWRSRRLTCLSAPHSSGHAVCRRTANTWLSFTGLTAEPPGHDVLWMLCKCSSQGEETVKADMKKTTVMHVEEVKGVDDMM